MAARPPTALAELLGHPLIIAAIGALFAGYSGYVTGQTRTTDQEARIKTLEIFAACAVRHFDRLEAGVRGPVPCVLGGTR